MKQTKHETKSNDNNTSLQVQTISINEKAELNKSNLTYNNTINKKNCIYTNKNILFKYFGYKKYGNRVRCIFIKPFSKYPLIVIGPHWYFFFLLHIIAIPVLIFISHHLFAYFKNPNMKLMFKILISIITFSFTTLYLINPGIILPNSPKLNENDIHCNICNSYMSAKLHCIHCEYCGICVMNLDHHCMWLGKCVGRYTKVLFYIMLTLICCAYFILFVSVMNYIIAYFRK